ncbi:MAG TPA: efflux RND transporter permease subunit [Terrimicrobiaceae bacterium]|nr:efflux RND transporter permease subunit [Terrimicrobiaceae bacterium]
MSLTDPFVRRPIMTTLVMLSILGSGLLAYFRLPVSDLPSVDFPTISVSASLPGASPETMASAVALPLEKEFSTIAGIESMTSTSSLGSTSVTIQFDLARDIDAAAQDVQAAISQAQGDLPTDMPNPPSFRKVNPADQAILMLAAYSDSLSYNKVDEYADTLIGQRLSTVTGVAQVDLYGSQKYAVRVKVDPRELAARGIGFDDVENAIREANSNAATGQLDTGPKARTIEATGQLTNAAQFRDLIVSYRAGFPVRLRQIATVVDGVEDEKNLGWYNQTRGVVIAIQKQPGANTVAVIDRIRELLPAYQAQLPGGMKLEILYDRSASIRESLHDVEFTLVLAVALVVMVIFIFLRNVRATLIPSAAIPLSIIGTFGVMYLLGFSVNNFSLMAMILAVGFVVDDAIVVLENIVRYIEKGDTPMEAALKGGREIGFTILSMTLSLAAVFIPVLFMGGILGRLLNEFAVTIAVAILISGFVSLSLTPMLCSRFLTQAHSASNNIVFRWSESLFAKLLAGYERTLKSALRHHALVSLAALFMAAATVGLFLIVPKGFLPSEDSNRIMISTEAEQGVSFEKMVELQQQAAAIVAKNPHVEGFMSRIGGGMGSRVGNTGRLFLTLKPRNERPAIDEIIRQLRKDLSGIPGLKVFPQNPPTIRIGGMQTKSLYQFTLFGPNLQQLYGAAAEMETRMRDIPGIVDVTTDLQITSPEVLVDINRDKASTLGVSAAQIERALGSAYGARQISTIYTPNNQYQVIIEAAEDFKREATDLSRLYVRSDQGRLVALDAVAKVKPQTGPLTVQHLGQFPAVTLSFDLAKGASLSTVVPVIERTADEVLPAEIGTQFQGTAQAFQSSLSNLGWLLVMAVVVIYIILGILYESFVHPLTILSGLPSAGFGALLTLYLFGMELNVYGFVGLLMLIGIVKKNAIMMIDFALEAQRNDRQPPATAIFQACIVRFRPIMMTTMAAMMGTLPIALGMGAGGDVRQPLGLSVVGGLIISQVVTLYITPIIYLYLERVNQWFRRRTKPGAEHPPSGIGAALAK